jgi:hypothetical protein
LLARYDPQRWLRVFIAALKLQMREFVSGLVIYADDITGGQFLPVLVETFAVPTDESPQRSKEDTAHIESWLRTAEESVLDARQRRDGMMALRFVGSGESTLITNSLFDPDRAVNDAASDEVTTRADDEDDAPATSTTPDAD